jgi:uncharacterized protein (TIGR03435 family)
MNPNLLSPPRPWLRVLTLAAFSALTAFGQSPSPPPAFDVASIRPAQDTGDGSGIVRPTPGLLRIRNVSVEFCIQQAWSLKQYQISVPGSLKSAAGQRYDIDAKAAGSVPKDQLMFMLRTLLTQRFHLAFHFEKRDLPVFALVVDKNWPKGMHDPASATDSGMNLDSTDSQGGKHWSFHNSTVAALAGLLSAPGLDRPVVDLTGVKDTFDFKFVEPAWNRAEGPLADHLVANVFPEVQRQLGLRVQAQTAPTDVLVIDQLDKTPVEN